jgi:hypothetical protein
VIHKSFRRKEILQERLEINSWEFHQLMCNQVKEELQVEDTLLTQATQLLQLVESTVDLEVKIWTSLAISLVNLMLLMTLTLNLIVCLHSQKMEIKRIGRLVNKKRSIHIIIRKRKRRRMTLQMIQTKIQIPLKVTQILILKKKRSQKRKRRRVGLA